MPGPATRRPRARAALRYGLPSGLVLGTGLVLALPNEETRCETSVEPLVLSGPQPDKVEAVLPSDTVVEAHDAQWSGTEPYALEVAGVRGVCVSGATVQGAWPSSTSWDVMHSTGAIVVSGRRIVVEDVRVDGYGDSLRFVAGSQDFVARRVHFSDSRDDCIENDWLHSGTVKDSLLDGCYNAFSAQGYGQQGLEQSEQNLWRIEDSLVRLQPMERPYRDRGLIPGTAGFFKWDPDGPRLSLHGNVFRADQPASTVGLALPAGKLADCSDNVMVWLGTGDYPADLPACFTVTRDRDVWDEAVAEWRSRYGGD